MHAHFTKIKNTESINNNSTAVNNSFITVNLSHFSQYRTCHKLCKQLYRNRMNFAQTKMKMAEKLYYQQTTHKKKKGIGHVYERHCTAYYRIKFKKSLQLMSSSSFTY